MSEDVPPPVSEAEELPEPAPRKKKKKRVAKASKSGDVKAEKVPPGEGTPAGEKLREALRAFEAGDYVRVRARCDELATALDPEVRAAAIELRERTTIDPIQIVVVLACAAVLLTIALVWVF